MDPIRYETLPLGYLYTDGLWNIEDQYIEIMGPVFGVIMSKWHLINDLEIFDTNRYLIKQLISSSKKTILEKNFLTRLEKIIKLSLIWNRDRCWRDPIPAIRLNDQRYYGGIDRVAVMKHYGQQTYRFLVIEKEYAVEANLETIRGFWTKPYGDNLVINNGSIENSTADMENFNPTHLTEWLSSKLPISLYASGNKRNQTIYLLRKI